MYRDMDLPTELVSECRKCLIESEWKHYNLFGGNKKLDILPCKRIKLNKTSKPMPNMLLNYGINWGGEFLEAYQCSYIAHYETVPNIIAIWNKYNDDDWKQMTLNEDNFETISHICLAPAVSGINPCIEATHMELETLRDNNDRRHCHNLIKAFESKIRWKGETPIGPIFVDDISQEYKYMIAKSMHISNKKKELMKYYECNHWPSCFINYGEIQSEK